MPVEQLTAIVCHLKERQVEPPVSSRQYHCQHDFSHLLEHKLLTSLPEHHWGVRFEGMERQPGFVQVARMHKESVAAARSCSSTKAGTSSAASHPRLLSIRSSGRLRKLPKSRGTALSPRDDEAGAAVQASEKWAPLDAILD